MTSPRTELFGALETKVGPRGIKKSLGGEKKGGGNGDLGKEGEMKGSHDAEPARCVKWQSPRGIDSFEQSGADRHTR